MKTRVCVRVYWAVSDNRNAFKKKEVEHFINIVKLILKHLVKWCWTVFVFEPARRVTLATAELQNINSMAFIQEIWHKNPF